MALQLLPASGERRSAGVASCDRTGANNAPGFATAAKYTGPKSNESGSTGDCAADGRVLDDQPAASLATARGILDTVYPFHTGQIGGWTGRMLVALLGAWLIAMICLGVASWQSRRHARSQ